MTVEPGWNLRTIGAAAYGHERFSGFVAVLNGIADPERVPAGAILKTPSLAVAFHDAGMDPTYQPALNALAKSCTDYYATEPAYLIGLQYPGKPLLVQQPLDQTVVAGTSATLSVIASSGVLMSYQWYRQPNGRPDGLIPGATNATYTTPALTNDATFWLSVSNSAGSVLSTPFH